MSFGVQTTHPIATIGEITLAAAEGEEVQQTQAFIDSSMPEAKGEMRVAQKNYTLSEQSATQSAGQFRSYIFDTGAKNAIKLPDNSPMRLATMTYRQTSTEGRFPSYTAGKPSAQAFSMPQTSGKPDSFSPTPLPTAAEQPHAGQTLINTPIPSARENFASPLAQASRSEASQPGERRAASAVRGQTRSAERNESRNPSSPLQSRQWAKEETIQWWEQRYHQKERDGQKHGQRHDQEHQDQHPDKKKKKSISGIAATSANKSQPTPQVYSEGGTEKLMQKPSLQKPKTGVFALYYILTKIGILSDGTSNFSYKKEIETVDSETTKAHKKRLDELKEAIEKEQAAQKWGIATKVFSWIGSLIGIIAGIALIATGVGAVAGAMMIAGGLIQITNQILEITGGWKKIAELLPGDDPEKKRAVINWMQIGIAVLCLILSGVGIIWGGYSNFGEAMQTARAVFGGIAAMGHGATTIGEGVTVFMFKDKMAEVKRYDKIIAELKHKRRDLMERVEWGVDRLEQLFEDLAKSLEFEVELFKADQMINR